MIKQVFLIFLFLSTLKSGLAQAPAWHWAKDANSSDPETLWEVSTDPTSTAIYVGGSFKGNLSLKYGASFASTSGNMDALVAKYDALGNVLWAFKISGSNGEEEVRGVAVDPLGDVYITGSFNSTADFDPSGATFNLTPSGNKDGFLAKYSSAGSFLWAVKLGGSADEISYKMFADANGIYITGSYESIPTTFYSYSSPITKTTFFTDSQLNMFGAKYNASGIVQWVISGGSNLDDYGLRVIADASNVYFLGVYYHDISFKNANGVSGATMPDEQHNEANTFILSVTQAGNLGWQTNITSGTGGKDVIGWNIAHDATNLYVTGQSDGLIHFKYPTPTLSQSVSSGNDLFLAKLSKAGNFLWNASATGSGNGEQIGRALEIDGSGNIILTGNFTSGLNYSSVGGPNFSATAQDVFITSYNNAGSFLWSLKAGGNNSEYVNGLAVDNSGNIYLAGEHGGASTFGTITLGSGGNADIFVAKLGCAIITNNTISAAQTICTGNAPSTLIGSIPSGGSLYSWQRSANTLTWTNASGTYTNQNYSPPTLTTTTYYKRNVNSVAACTNISSSPIVTITVNGLPSVAAAGSNQTVCASSTSLNANTPLVGTGQWSVNSGTATIVSPTNNVSGITNLTPGQTIFMWTITNGSCPPSTSTVSVFAETPLSLANAGSDQQVCSSTCTLNATSSPGSGTWSLLSGNGNITNNNTATTTVNSLNAGQNVFVWLITKPNCPSTSDTITIIRDLDPTISNAGPDQTICGPNTNVIANTPIVGSGIWQIVAGNGNFSNISSSQSNITNLSVGANKFVWTVSNGVCPQSLDTIVINSDANPSDPFAGADTLICGDVGIITAASPLVGVGSWSLFSGSGNVTNISANSIQINLPDTFANVLKWTIKNGVCPDKTDYIKVTRVVAPSVADAGIDQVTEMSFQRLNAVAPIIGTGKWSVIEGNAEFENVNDPATVAKQLAIGNNILRWTTYNGTCRENTDDILVYVKPLTIPNGFSPNADGFNDKFVITSLDYYEQAKFSVFNRWGALLYSNNNYKNDWAGTNSNNEKLVDDTYYYLLEIPGLKTLTGFIVLKQNR